MAQDHVLNQNSQALRKIRQSRHLLPQHALRNRDVPDQLALQRVAKGPLPAQLLHFADIVQNRSRDQQLRIDLRIKRRRPPANTHQRQHMFQQATQPRMVQPLRRWRISKRRANLRIIEKREHQPLQIFIRKLRHIPAQLRPHPLYVELRRRHVIRRFHLRLAPHGASSAA